jgi:hypothetical protein
MTTLAESLPREQARVRALIGMYREIGPSGTFAIMMMEQALSRAEKAAAEGDIAAMIRAQKDLEGFTE